MTDVPDFDRRQAALARIAAVRSRFIEGLDERLAELSRLARQSAEPDGAAAWDSLRLGLHNLSGGAPSLGLNELGRRAAVLERFVIQWRRPDGGLPPDASLQIAEDVLTLRGDAPRE